MNSVGCPAGALVAARAEADDLRKQLAVAGDAAILAAVTEAGLREEVSTANATIAATSRMIEVTKVTTFNCWLGVDHLFECHAGSVLLRSCYYVCCDGCRIRCSSRDAGRQFFVVLRKRYEHFCAG